MCFSSSTWILHKYLFFNLLKALTHFYFISVFEKKSVLSRNILESGKEKLMRNEISCFKNEKPFMKSLYLCFKYYVILTCFLQLLILMLRLLFISISKYYFYFQYDAISICCLYLLLFFLVSMYYCQILENFRYTSFMMSYSFSFSWCHIPLRSVKDHMNGEDHM